MGLVQKYQELVRNNAEIFSASEWALSNLTWLLPDRFADSELTVEGFHALLGLLSLYHDSIISTPPVPVPKSKQPLPWIFWLGAIQQVSIRFLVCCARDCLLLLIGLVNLNDCNFRWCCLGMLMLKFISGILAK